MVHMGQEAAGFDQMNVEERINFLRTQAAIEVCFSCIGASLRLQWWLKTVKWFLETSCNSLFTSLRWKRQPSSSCIENNRFGNLCNFFVCLQIKANPLGCVYSPRTFPLLEKGGNETRWSGLHGAGGDYKKTPNCWKCVLCCTMYERGKLLRSECWWAYFFEKL